jgi:nucleoid-associated protein YgaU
VTPQVESWDEETYRIKAGDNFARISAAHYNTDKYAKALERFNVNHPQAGEHMRMDPPRLEAGQLVYIPPAYILEKRYGKAFIPGFKPQAEPTATNDPTRTANSSPRADSADSASPSFKEYRVTPGGQMIRDIARATLGNPERWKEIYKLNPTINTAYPVPGDQLIKVPADARIPAANTPQAGSR